MGQREEEKLGVVMIEVVMEIDPQLSYIALSESTPKRKRHGKLYSRVGRPSFDRNLASSGALKRRLFPSRRFDGMRDK